ncbi:hypothetical protein GQ44DRAFT_737121 [Phaeosphaeriaceae sp. PMI808]|nr:hypothetical protein GQ44DRAFT_737121 [Phaeosphaeriaceae sp. PMI808]
MDHASFFRVLFGDILGHGGTIVRYLGLIVNSIAHWLYKPIPVPENPTHSCKDITIILPTISTDIDELRQTIQSVLACNPIQILLFSKPMNSRNLKVPKVPVANKRLKVRQAVPIVETRITVMADDDVTWPSTIFPWILAPFEDKNIGAVGASQRVRRLKTGTIMERCHNWSGAEYIERRNFEISATQYIDRGTSCMSGRTYALQAKILQDDDNFITRWLYSRECDIETTLENNPKFRFQSSRNNYTSLFIERRI